MARPKKRTVDYFPHECDHGKTIHALENKFGNDGYAFFFKMLETLGSTDGHYLDFSKDENAIFLSSEANISEEKCIEIINLLARLESIDQELWEEQKVIWSSNFVENITDAYKKRETEIPKKPVFDDKNHSFRDENTQSKVKKSKEKNIYREKVREIFDHWVESEAGVKHRKIKEAHKKAIRARLKDGFSVDELKTAISNLAEAYNSDDYYWSHKWTCKEFMSRQQGGKVEQFLDGIEEFKTDGGGQVSLPSLNELEEEDEGYWEYVLPDCYESERYPSTAYAADIRKINKYYFNNEAEHQAIKFLEEYFTETGTENKGGLKEWLKKKFKSKEAVGNDG